VGVAAKPISPSRFFCGESKFVRPASLSGYDSQDIFCKVINNEWREQKMNAERNKNAIRDWFFNS